MLQNKRMMMMMKMMGPCCCQISFPSTRGSALPSIGLSSSLSSSLLARPIAAQWPPTAALTLNKEVKIKMEMKKEKKKVKMEMEMEMEVEKKKKVDMEMGRVVSPQPPPPLASLDSKPGTCTAPELHYVAVPLTSWRLALWRYLPSPQVPRRNHPILMLSGVGTNAIVFDLHPKVSLARFLCEQGFDTWVLEVRGSGLSRREEDYLAEENKLFNAEMTYATRRSHLSSQEKSKNWMTNYIDDVYNRLELNGKYDYDFQDFLEGDVPAAIKYIQRKSAPKDGKVHAIGHSMGGIILYALLASQGYKCCLASVVALASSLEYGVSNTSLKMLLPLVNPLRALNVPYIPLGAVMQAIHPLSSRPPYVLSWLSSNVSAEGTMDPELLEKLVLNTFCTVSAKLLLQLTTVFQPGGLRNRTGSFVYKYNLSKTNIPVLASACNKDLVCPPEAVIDTVKAFQKESVQYKLFGGKGNHHYGHYDILCGRMAMQEVFPAVEKFLVSHDDCQI